MMHDRLKCNNVDHEKFARDKVFTIQLYFILSLNH